MDILFITLMLLVFVGMYIGDRLHDELKAQHKEIWQEFYEPSKWFFGPIEMRFFYKFILVGGFKNYELSSSVSSRCVQLQALFTTEVILFVIWSFIK